MELVVIPNIENESDRQRAQDELPQSAVWSYNYDDGTEVCSKPSGFYRSR